MITTDVSFRSLLLLALPTMLAAGCDLELIGEHLPIEDDDFVPERRVAAISDNHEHVVVASSATNTLRLVSSNGNPTDDFPLPLTWRPIGAATYYGPDFDFGNINQANEAVIVLHQNGAVLPWFHHGGQLRFHWNGLIQVPPSPANVAAVSYLDVDQSHDGVLYVLTHEFLAAGGDQARIWRRDLDGTWDSVAGADKPAALAYDQGVDDVTVVYTRTSNRDVTLEEYDEDLSFNRSRTLPDLAQVSDLEVLGGWLYLGVLSCANAACNETERELQLRDANLGIDATVPLATEGVALDLPPFPLDLDSNVDVWRVGRAQTQLSEYDVIAP